MVYILTPFLAASKDGYGRLINIAFRAPGLSVSTTVVATASISSSTSMCEPCAEDNLDYSILCII